MWNKCQANFWHLWCVTNNNSSLAYYGIQYSEYTICTFVNRVLFKKKIGFVSLQSISSERKYAEYIKFTNKLFIYFQSFHWTLWIRNIHIRERKMEWNNGGGDGQKEKKMWHTRRTHSHTYMIARVNLF